MTSPIPMQPGQPDATTPDKAPPDFDITLSDVVDNAGSIIVEAFQDLTESPVDIAKGHLDHVGELQMHSVEALMNDDPGTAQALLAQADQEMSDAAHALHSTDQSHTSG